MEVKQSLIRSFLCLAIGGLFGYLVAKSEPLSVQAPASQAAAPAASPQHAAPEHEGDLAARAHGPVTFVASSR